MNDEIDEEKKKIMIRENPDCTVPPTLLPLFPYNSDVELQPNEISMLRSLVRTTKLVGPQYIFQWPFKKITVRMQFYF